MSWFRRLFGGVSRALIAAAIEVAVAEAKARLDKAHEEHSLSASQVAVAKAAIDDVAVGVQAEVDKHL